jgi:hypothetical protein
LELILYIKNNNIINFITYFNNRKEKKKKLQQLQSNPKINDGTTHVNDSNMIIPTIPYNIIKKEKINNKIYIIKIKLCFFKPIISKIQKSLTLSSKPIKIKFEITYDPNKQRTITKNKRNFYKITHMKKTNKK